LGKRIDKVENKVQIKEGIKYTNYSNSKIIKGQGRGSMHAHAHLNQTACTQR